MIKTMGLTDGLADHVISKLLDMGFEFEKALEAVEAVGPVLNDAVDFMLNDSCNKSTYGKSQHDFTCSKTRNCSSVEDVKTSSESLQRMKQSHLIDHLSSLSRGESHLTDHLPSLSRVERDISASSCEPPFTGVMTAMTMSLDGKDQVCVDQNNRFKDEPFPYLMDCRSDMLLKEPGVLSQRNGSFQHQQVPQLLNPDVQATMLNWEQKVGDALQKHFGFSSLKGFQKEAIKAWLAHKDCLILAATGSGKSLCFQIPGLLSGKIVVVISPLISLMRDQCLKLARHGISACFLGSGQLDGRVEQEAMNGLYRIVYVCPETVLRLIEPLKSLAENNMIALFAIDEVHCVSKWGHDFRPDYRRLSVLRENFDIPLMALTATATLRVREDVLKTLLMSKETKVVLTSFFRPNLRFSVKHSRTSFASSYDRDFNDLVNIYTTSRMNNSKGKNKNFYIEEDVFHCPSTFDASSDEDDTSKSDNYFSDDNSSSEISSDKDHAFPWGIQLSNEYLEDDSDIYYNVNDLDASCTEFLDSVPDKNIDPFKVTEASDTLESLGHGPTIIYVPTRKETTKLAEYFCRSGVRAAAYHAKLPKAHLRRVHEDFQQNLIEVVVATIAFGMGIDKSNVRRIIHYGWPQSLEGYYQEAGRAGRDGKLSDCILYADFWKCPTLLPSKRSEEQTRQAYKMLSDCFRYGMDTTTCRARTLVEYFGEKFNGDGCSLCDNCISGPPPQQNLAVEVNAFLHTLMAECAYMDETSFGFASHIGAIYCESSKRLLERSNFRNVIDRLREQHPKFLAIDRSWWRGLARIIEDKGFIKEADDQVRVSVKYPQLTKLGLKFLNSRAEDFLYAHPYADMLVLSTNDMPYSSFSEWGKGWADPEIRRQRLQGSKRGARKAKNDKLHSSSSKRGKGWGDSEIRCQRLQGSKRGARKTKAWKTKKSKRN